MPTNAAQTLPIQPLPVNTEVAHTYPGGRCATAIMRDWRHGDAERCQLCPSGGCSAKGRDHCLVVVTGFVPYDSAALFSTVGRPRHSDALRAHADHVGHGSGA